MSQRAEAVIIESFLAYFKMQVSKSLNNLFKLWLLLAPQICKTKEPLWIRLILCTRNKDFLMSFLGRTGLALFLVDDLGLEI